MSTGWIEAVLRMNAQVVVAEARFNAQVARVVELAERGQDTFQEQKLLCSYRTSLDLFRAMQAQLLREANVCP